MGSERITVTLPPELVANARIAVRSGAAASLSAFVADALRGQLERNQALIREAEEALQRSLQQQELEATFREAAQMRQEADATVFIHTLMNRRHISHDSAQRALTEWLNTGRLELLDGYAIRLPRTRQL